MTAWLTVVGIGDDGLEGLQPAARVLIEGAELLVGGDRHQAMVPHTAAERLTWANGLEAAMDAIDQWRGRQVVVLATGDPMCFGAGANLRRRFDVDEMTVLPHPGSFNLVAARMVWSLPDVEMVTVHGRPLEVLHLAIQPRARLIVLSRDGDSPAQAAALLTERGFGPSSITVFEHLGGPKERRLEGIAEAWPHSRCADLNTMAIECRVGPDARILPPVPGLPDEVFESDGQLTKREVRAATIAALAPLPGQVLWDVGAGSGSVAIEWLRAAPRLRPAGREEIVIETPMAEDRYPAREVYDRYARTLAGRLADGRDVAVLCEGDPFLYGSFMYLFERLADDHPTEVIPGVSSLTAVAAVAGVPLASRNQVLAVIPAPLPEPELEARLAAADAMAIMKVGRHLPKVRRVLRRLGREESARYVERATMDNQRVGSLAEVDDRSAPYFSMILVGARANDDQVAVDIPFGAAVVAWSAHGLALARRLQPTLPGATVHGLAGRADDADVPFSDTGTHLRGLFAQGTPIVGICAAGILIRALAPALADKAAEPPVIAVSESGGVAVPLLGGHNGANRLARAIAGALRGTAAITTAGDVRLGLALDDPPAGWRVADRAAAKPVAAALLAGEPVALSVEAGGADWLLNAGTTFTDEGRPTIRVTDRRPEESEPSLVLHPPVLAVGVGCERGADPDAVVAHVRATLDAAGLAEEAVACVASVDVKADDAAVHAVAAALGVPARFFPPAALEAETPRLANPSEAVFRAIDCHGVAEAAALAATGPDGRLAVAKTKAPRATCAVARAPSAIDPETVGRRQGCLSVVGIGPGDAGWRAPEATMVLASATDIVGLPFYLELIAGLTAGKALHPVPMTAEEARVRTALDLAAEGRRVALVSTGDAGIYALAALVFELLDREDRTEWNRLAIDVVPGISALQAAAARAGAPIGHDFCAVSLSDLLTPWPDIERRIEAAAVGDFVVAFYNPVSQRRRTQLARARDILLDHRPAETPVCWPATWAARRSVSRSSGWPT